VAAPERGKACPKSPLVGHVADLMIAAAGADLLMVVIYRDDLTSTGLSLWLYCFHLAVFGLVGLLLHGLQRRSGSASSAG
jgi:hypothetical protein